MTATWIIWVLATVLVACPAHSRPSNTINSHHHHHHHHRHGHQQAEERLQAAEQELEQARTALEDATLLEELNQTLNSWNVSNTSLDDARLSNLSKTARERNREMRLQAIKQQIMSYRQHPSGIDPPSINIPPNIFDKIAAGTLNISHQLPPFATYTMKRQSFHPSCTLPNNTDMELWTEGNSMNLLFNLTYKAPANTSVTIVAATLRLYKHSQNNHTTVEQTCAPLVAPLSSEPQLDAPVTTPDDDKKIRASVYWYTRSLKKNKVKRKLVDSKMLSIYGSEWVEFNVRPAAKQWRASGKNFGLVVEVEDEDGEVLKAQDYFSMMNCSHEASTARPLPAILFNAARAYYAASIGVNIGGNGGIDPNDASDYFPTSFNHDDELQNSGSPDDRGSNGHKRDTAANNGDDASQLNSAAYFHSLLFPVIELCTVEVPTHEAAAAAYMQQMQYILTQYLAACKYMDNDAASAVGHDNSETPIETEAKAMEGSSIVSESYIESHKKRHQHGTDEEKTQRDSSHVRGQLRHHKKKQVVQPPEEGEQQEEEEEEEEQEVLSWADDGHEIRQKIIVHRIFSNGSNNRHRNSSTVSSQQDSDR